MPLTVTTNRNNTDLVFTQEELKRGKNKGALIMAPPKITTDNLDTIVKWIGAKELAGILYGRLRNLSSGWTESAEDSEGNFQADPFKTYAESFSARGETMEELGEQIENLLEEMGEMSEKGDADGIVANMKAIKALKSEIESKKRPRKNKSNSETAVAAATA